ncbi:hypothetical protein SLH46_07545 [Draconibacterium sp. IB214405]|uniref:hypothetical protein n=1 Tax=Draconibacterium sp. IB214405 TaxID=3097352 RepID=UPI002A10E2EA|nr:hypothetical protein [Draconibacterium sp. IB214405]MDX8339032.1 hypothetical protein [Draconibacterium sp. IB214405]
MNGYIGFLKVQTILICLLFIGFLSTSNKVNAQQFYTDSYVTMPKGTGTFILTSGEHNANIYSVFALFKGFELNFQATLFYEDKPTNATNYFTTNIYAKYTFWVSNDRSAGAAVFLGIGKAPGYFTNSGYSAMHKNYWTAVPVTIPLFGNTISWDIMPGGLVDFDYGDNDKTAWGFTYSSRIAIYKVIPKTAIVGEIFGTEGQVHSKPEFKAGLRWEPNPWIVVAGTYGAMLDGGQGSGFELGVMIFTPKFLSKDFMRNNEIQY